MGDYGFDGAGDFGGQDTNFNCNPDPDSFEKKVDINNPVEYSKEKSKKMHGEELSKEEADKVKEKLGIKTDFTSYPVKIFTFEIPEFDERWEFRGNFCSEQFAVRKVYGQLGPETPFFLCKREVCKNELIRYCVDGLGRVWYSINSLECHWPPLKSVPLESPCLRACLADLDSRGLDIEEVKKAVSNGRKREDQLISQQML